MSSLAPLLETFNKKRQILSYEFDSPDSALSQRATILRSVGNPSSNLRWFSATLNSSNYKMGRRRPHGTKHPSKHASAVRSIYDRHRSDDRPAAAIACHGACGYRLGPLGPRTLAARGSTLKPRTAPDPGLALEWSLDACSESRLTHFRIRQDIKDRDVVSRLKTST